MPKKSENTFEEKLKRLEDIVETLDKGEEPLEELLKLYEDGMKIANSCREFLDKAELKVIEISKNSKTMNDKKYVDESLNSTE